MNVAINGFGRIGRLVFRRLMDFENLNVVAINDITDPQTLAHLLKYDSAQGKFNYPIEIKGTEFIIAGKSIKIFAERDPEKLPWKELEIDLVVEATGFFRKKKEAEKHITAGAKKVIISAPAKDTIDATIVMGVNEKTLKKDDKIISNASCTTNCLAPLMKVIVDEFGVEAALMTTIHSYTSDQKILDSPHSDLRRARTAAVNIIPTTTGAASATGKVIPALAGKIDGMAVRVPTQDGSLVDVSIVLKKETSIEEINNSVKNAAETYLKGILEYSDEPLVSTDIIGNPYSSVFDSKATMVNGKFIKLLSWYDNEWGYSCRIVDLINYIKNME